MDLPQPISTPSTSPRLDIAFPWDLGKPLGKDLRRQSSTLEGRFKSLEENQVVLADATGLILQQSEQMIAGVLGPTYEALNAYATLGFLVARSDTLNTLVVNEARIFTILEGAQRDLFTPTAFVGITREAEFDDYAVARVEAYDKEFGDLHVTLMYVQGSAGPFDDWVISASAAATLASRQWAIDSNTAMVAAQAAATSAQNDADQVATDKTAVFNDRVVVQGLSGAVATNAAQAQAAREACEDIQSDLENLEAIADPEGLSTLITDLQTQKAPLASPAFTGTPTAPTAAAGTSTTQLATTAFLQAALTALKGSATAAGDTLGELEAALGSKQAAAATLAALMAMTMPAGASFGVPVYDSLSDAHLCAASGYGLSLLAISGAAALRANIGADNASNLTTGTIDAARLPSQIAGADTAATRRAVWLTTY